MRIVRYVGKGRGLAAEYKNAVANGSRTTVINNLRDGRNVTVDIKLDGKAIEFDNDPLTRDFLDLATLIYIADELELRKRAKDHWSRHFDVIAPVKHPKRWEKHGGAFQKMLGTLAGDEYHFIWLKRPKLDSLGHHRKTLPTGFDSVCLFSGGMDSFLGAYKLLTEGKKLLLVGHQADTMAAPAQKALAKWLQGKFPNACCLVQWRVAYSRTKEHKFSLRRPTAPEDSHRPRSLLFLALAVSIANATGVKIIYLPENGLIAINAPLQKSRIGTLSTRTAHPRYLGELADFLRDMGIYTGEIKNPFLFMSKTDMARKRKSLATPLVRSVSCSRPSRYKDRGVKHCGYCVPCIYRRIAMMEAGLDAKTDYAFSVFDDLPEMDVLKQLDFRALVRWAERVQNATAFDREMLVLSHGSFPISAAERFGPHAADSYAVWGDMLRDWSADFLAKLDSAAAPAVKQTLGRTVRRKKVHA